MKKIIFLLALLASMAANAAVTVTPLSANYGATKTVTFRVSWEGTATDRAWVWVDLCPVTGTSPGTFAKAVISGATATAGNIETVTGNTRGFYVTTNPSTVTATLSNATGKFNWCVYGSDAPPNVTFDEGTYTFKGTTDFIVSEPAQTLTAGTIAKANLNVTSSSTFTDATGCPGIGSLYCPYTGSDLYMDAGHLCQQRAGGAQNWEAWIKDTRDNELYRIVFMPDNTWWLAQNVRYANTGSTNSTSGCTDKICGRLYTKSQANGSHGGTSGFGENVQGVCPKGWGLPMPAHWTTLFNSISTTAADVCEALRAHDSACSPRPDTYGFANLYDSGQNGAQDGDHWWPNTDCYAARIDHVAQCGGCCGRLEVKNIGCSYTGYAAAVRCIH